MVIKKDFFGENNNNFKDKTGEKHITNQGYEVEIIEYKTGRNMKILFSNGYLAENVNYSNLSKGGVAYPYHPSVCGIGYLGIGSFKSRTNKKYTPYYLKWQDMLFRCYSEKSIGSIKSYKDVSVCEEWHNFQNFAQWFEYNYDSKTMQGWAIDKDILVKGNKVYSPTTCCFVPQQINGLFVNKKEVRGLYPVGVRKTNNKFEARFGSKSLGRYQSPEEAFEVHKTAKENYIKEVAELWKGKISDKVYQAMYNYKIEITD